MAVDAGARAIVVFNHDGRVLDNAPVAADVLPEIADAVKGKVAILVDGGGRTGGDTFNCWPLAPMLLCPVDPFPLPPWGGSKKTFTNISSGLPAN